jgi:SAM-dependent methyltransferase
MLNANLQAGMHVLDVGSGGSPFPLYLGMSGFECYATDPNLDQGKPKKNWRRRIIFLLGITSGWYLSRKKRSLPVRYYPDSIQELSFPAGFFDRVFCLSVIEHIPQSDWILCMEQLSRVVKSGGRLVLTFDMSAQDANAYLFKHLIAACPLDLIGNIDYPVPIPDEDKRLRHGHTYETVGLVWQKR